MKLAPPRLRLIKVLGTIKVLEVDGGEARKKEPDFTDFAESRRFPELIPKDEFWIDTGAHPREWPYFVYEMLVYHHERLLGRSHSAAQKKADKLEQQLRKREEPPQLLKKKHPDDFVIKDLGEMAGVHVVVVDGEAVSDDLYDAWTGGGHDLRYKFIPDRTVWLDDRVVRESPREALLYLIHELIERSLMASGMKYLEAHEKATEVENRLRKAHGLPLRKALAA